MHDFQNPVSLDHEKLIAVIKSTASFEEVIKTINIYCGSYQRMNYALLVFQPTPEWFKFLGTEIWTMSDNVGLYKTRLKAIFQKHPHLTKYMMDDTDLKTLENLPDNLTVYRGQSRTRTIGLSWTLDKKLAISFVTEMHRYITPYPALFTATINKKDIIAVITSRNENEIICMPQEYTKESLKLKS